MHFIHQKMTALWNEKLALQKLLYCNQSFSQFWTHFDDRPKILTYRQISPNIFYLSLSFFSFVSDFSFTDTDDAQDSREREGTIFYSTLPLPPVHENSHIYLQICMRDDDPDHRLYFPDCCSMGFTTLSNCYLIDWWCDIKFLFLYVMIWF